MHTASNESQYGLPYWLNLDRPVFPHLDGDTAADVAVIGAGLCGLKLARCLARYGIKTIILEGGRVGEGASSRNQGSINHDAGMGYAECIRRSSRQVARALWQLGLENHKLLCDQIDEYSIDCDYQIDGYTSLVCRDVDGWEDELAVYKADYDLLVEDGFEVALLDENEALHHGGNPLFTGGLCYLANAQFHSGKYVIGLAQGISRLADVKLFEGTRVQKIQGDESLIRLMTTRGIVSAERVFLATNALAPQFVPSLERGLRAERGQVFVTEPLAQRPCTGSFSIGMAWWREVIEPDGRFCLVFGGGRKRDEPDSLFPQFSVDGAPHPKLECGGFSPSVEHQQRLDMQFDRLFPTLANNVRITHRWGGLQSFTADYLPMIGEFDAERRIHGMAGFSGRGNCYSDVGAEFLAGKVAGVESRVEKEFGSLIEMLMKVGRVSANWEPWYSIHSEEGLVD